MRVVRTGQKPKPNDGRWTDAAILAAWWEMEESKGGRKNPMNQIPQDIPQLKPIPEKEQERDDWRQDNETR